MRRRTHRSLWIAGILVAAVIVALVLKKNAPPEAARLLPESDAIVYVNLKTVRSVTHFDESPIIRSSDYQHFIDATGIAPERDLDAVAFGLHAMPDPHGPNGPVAYSEVFVGRFDGIKLAKYLTSMASAQETYAGHDIYTIPVEGRQLRVAQVGYDTIAASNMPTSEQIHSMLDRYRASALWTPGSSLLAARYSEVPLLSQAWGIGHIGLPFASNGRISILGLELPLSEDTDLVASLRYSGSVHLRVEEIAPSDDVARHTVDTMTALIGFVRGMENTQHAQTPGALAMHNLLGSVEVAQHKERAILSASATTDQLKALADAAKAPPTAPTPEPAPVASPKPPRASKHK
jgi:hypothetical protein